MIIVASEPNAFSVQSRIQGYMYNITSETNYSERLLPPTPPREKEASPPIAERHINRRAIIDEPPAGGSLAQQSRPQSAAPRAGERPLVAGSAGHQGTIFRQSCSSHQVVLCFNVFLPRPCETCHQGQRYAAATCDQRLLQTLLCCTS
jgi:hypothetical protein